jgi:hypothetical protein
MYNHNPQSEGDQANLNVLGNAADAPTEAYESDPEVRAAFDEELRKMAEEIVQYHPSLTQLLLSMGPKSEDESDAPPLHGRN